MQFYLAIDIGASSGRHIVGWRERGEVQTREVYRFPNGVIRRGGHLTWDLDALLRGVRAGIRAAKEAFPEICSMAIDTWGVDYVLMQDDREVLPAYAYRDDRTADVIPLVHETVPFEELYRRTGCQFQPFNTVYQLAADRLTGRLDGVTDFLMIPEYIAYRLTGVKVKEYTNATTTGLVSAETGDFDRELTARLGLPLHLFPPLCRPGTEIGTCDGIPVVLAATHDTASAVEGIPMGENELYISSGTWSLLGVKTERPLTDDASRATNYSNEGGVGYNRYQKNIMGLWLISELRRELCPTLSPDEVEHMAESSTFDGTADVSDARFLAPESMKAAFDSDFDESGEPRPSSTADYLRAAYRSLARCYGSAVSEIEHNLGRTFRTLTVVGGGAKDTFLTRLTAEYTKKRVVSLPIEATALGNLKIQMEAAHDTL